MGIGIEGRVLFADHSPEDWVEVVSKWKKLDVTHISVNTMKAGLSGPDAHIQAIRRFKEAVAGM
jgi:hypothetical protein